MYRMYQSIKLIVQQAQCDGLSFSLHLQLMSLLSQYHQNLHRQELLWPQKSRILWMLVGDANTSYFHKSTLLRRRRNQILSLTTSQGDCLNDAEAIKNCILHHFMLRQTKEAALPPLEHLCVTPPLSIQQNEALIQSEDEILMSLKSMHPDKASGPHGLSLFFFHYYQPLIKSEVILDVEDFFPLKYSSGILV